MTDEIDLTSPNGSVDVASSVELNEAQMIEFTAEHPTKLVNDILATAIRMRATDVHLDAYNGDVHLRFRINGVMRPILAPLTPENAIHVIARLKVMANLDIVEKRRPQGGSFCVNYSDKLRRHAVNVRLPVVPGAWGEIVALRLLDPLHFEVTLDNLGMPPSILALYRKLAAFPNGLLLVTGPTGSGKSTTLYCTIRELERRRDIKIVTIEDPIEYHFEKVCQTQVSDQMGFPPALRAFLRQNADVLMVGEIRDSETAGISVRAATAGHLILSAIHTRDAIAAIARMRYLQVSDDLLSATLIGVVAQRLARRICEHCRIECTPAPELVASFYKQPPPRFFRGAGCDKCDRTGCSG